MFLNQPLLIVEDPRHSLREPRFHALGRTDDGRLLHVTFTLGADASRIRCDLGPRHEPQGEGTLCPRELGRS